MLYVYILTLLTILVLEYAILEPLVFSGGLICSYVSLLYLQELESTEKTKAALERITQQKLMASQPTKGIHTESAEPQYIRYTPAQKGEQFNSGATTRIVRMVEVASDPMEPPKVINSFLKYKYKSHNHCTSPSEDTFMHLYY